MASKSSSSSSLKQNVFVQDSQCRLKVFVSELISIITTAFMIVFLGTSLYVDHNWNTIDVPVLDIEFKMQGNHTLTRPIGFDLTSIILTFIIFIAYFIFLILAIVIKKIEIISVAINAIVHIIGIYCFLVINLLLLLSAIYSTSITNEYLLAVKYTPLNFFFRLAYASGQSELVLSTFVNLPDNVTLNQVKLLYANHSEFIPQLIWTKYVASLFGVFSLLGSAVVISFLLKAENPPVIKPINGRYLSPAQIKVLNLRNRKQVNVHFDITHEFTTEGELDEIPKTGETTTTNKEDILRPVVKTPDEYTTKGGESKEIFKNQKSKVVQKRSSSIKQI